MKASGETKSSSVWGFLGRSSTLLKEEKTDEQDAVENSSDSDELEEDY